MLINLYNQCDLGKAKEQLRTLGHQEFKTSLTDIHTNNLSLQSLCGHHYGAGMTFWTFIDSFIRLDTNNPAMAFTDQVDKLMNVSDEHSLNHASSMLAISDSTVVEDDLSDEHDTDEPDTVTDFEEYQSLPQATQTSLTCALYRYIYLIPLNSLHK